MNGSREIPPELLMKLYTAMVKIRKVEEKIGEHYPENEMRTPIHLCIGQEAVAAGVCVSLNKDDYVFSNHRGHGHYIAKKGNLNTMIAELYNKETGCSRGRGGSMHLVDTSVGLLGSSSIVAGGIPLATGAALAAKLSNNNQRVAIVFFGDGAAEEGVLYESINFAVLKKLPIIYVCENNLYSVCSPLATRQPQPDIDKRAQGFSIPSDCVDGNDVLAVYEAASQAIDYARQGQGPSFIECKTYRLTDHHDRKTGVEVGYQPQPEWDEWAAKCPIKRLEDLLKNNNLIDSEYIKTLNADIDQKIEAAFEFALNSPLPDKKEIEKYLYS